jgi:hypothetical protein
LPIERKVGKRFAEDAEIGFPVPVDTARTTFRICECYSQHDRRKLKLKEKAQTRQPGIGSMLQNKQF